MTSPQHRPGFPSDNMLLKPAYTELQTTTNFSFLRGASHVEELFARAAVLGIPALGITDRGTLAGIVRAHQRAEETNVRCIIGTRLDLTDGASVLVYPTDQPPTPAFAASSPWAKVAPAKAAATLTWNDLAAAADGMIAILCSAPTPQILQRLKADFTDRAYLALTVRRRPNDAVRLHEAAPNSLAMPGPHRCHRRCAVSRARPAHPCRRADLHPRRPHHR